MGREYSEAERLMDRLRRMSEDYTTPLGACEAYTELLDALARLEFETYRHIHEEESILYPEALDSFADPQASLSSL
jgi:regulator of cell morphogenesis and NO signaling